MTHDPALFSIANVSKTYGAVEALRDVEFSIDAGEVVALVGDNGAGKSTMIRIVSGTTVPDTAEFRLRGESVKIGSPRDAAGLGIATLYQDLALCDNLDVVANLFLGQELATASVLDEVRMERRAMGYLDELSIRLRSIRAATGELSGGQRQSVAIARSLLGDPQIVLLDEPTAALGVAQRRQVSDLILRLRARGLGVVLISHNLAEVFEVADRIEVLRLGRNAGSFPARPEFQDSVVAAITGASVGQVPPS